MHLNRHKTAKFMKAYSSKMYGRGMRRTSIKRRFGKIVAKSKKI